MTDISKCPIWGTDASITEDAHDRYFVNSERAGGRYSISGTAAKLSKELDAGRKARLTTWLVDQRRAGIATPYIDSEQLDAARERTECSWSKKVERFFLYLRHRNFQPSTSLSVRGTEIRRIEKDKREIAAWTDCESEPDAANLLRLMQEEGYLSGDSKLRLSAKGFSKLEAVAGRNSESSQVFVAMWFDPQMDDIFEKGFEPAIREAKLAPFRIDKKEHNNKIDDEIISEIRRSGLLVADFTCGMTNNDGSPVAIARGGVYYEAGFAQGLGIPVIWTCREDSISHVHFDTRQFNHIVWANAEDLKARLLNRIRAMGFGSR